MNSHHPRLSPLNFQRFVTQSHLESSERVKEKKARQVERVTMWRCPECTEVYEWRDEAEECCPEEIETEQWKCPLCTAPNESAREAADCCLWKDFDAPTRWRMADAVDAGGTWADELGVQVEHLPKFS